MSCDDWDVPVDGNGSGSGNSNQLIIIIAVFIVLLAITIYFNISTYLRNSVKCSFKTEQIEAAGEL